MTQKTHLLSTIAAVAAIALVPTGVAAQQTQPDTSATSTTSTPTPAPAPTDAAPATTAPATSPDTTAAPDAVAPAVSSDTTTTTTPTRVIHHRVAAAPVKHSVAAAAPAPVARTAARPTHASAPAAPVKSAPAQTASTAAAPPPLPAAPRAIAHPASTTDTMAGWVIPAAILAGLIVLALIVFALNRRRCRRALEREEAVWYDEQPVAEPEVAPAMAEPAWSEDLVPPPEPVAQPELVAPAATAAVITKPEPADSTLPAGFDISRFGPHVQAAYRGPTPDNPSLSLRHRLRRAAALDQAERRAAAERTNGTQNAGFMFPNAKPAQDVRTAEYES